MSNTNTGGPAFPVADPFAVKCPPTDAEALRLQQGMTLRDYFAAKALQGLLATDLNCAPEYVQAIADSSYVLADAMMKARES